MVAFAFLELSSLGLEVLKVFLKLSLYRKQFDIIGRGREVLFKIQAVFQKTQITISI